MMNRNRFAKKLSYIVTKQKAFIAIIIILIAMIFVKSNFYTAYNLFDMVNSATINMIVAFGITRVIIAQGIDLAVGVTLAVAGITVIKLIPGCPRGLRLYAQC